MTRIILVAALVFSLWPVAWIGWIGVAAVTAEDTSSSPSSTSVTTSESSSADTSSQESQAESDSGGDSIGLPETTTSKEPKASSGGSTREGKYSCPYYAASRAQVLKSDVRRLDRKLKRIKARADEGSAYQAEIETYNRLIPEINDRVRTYNRYLKRECVG